MSQVVVSRDRARAKKRPEGGRHVGATIAAEDELVEGGGEMAPRDARAVAALAGLPSRPRVRFFGARLPPSRPALASDCSEIRARFVLREDRERRRSRPESWAARVVLRSDAAGPVRRPGAPATSRFVP
jgi:hypothetical protein